MTSAYLARGETPDRADVRQHGMPRPWLPLCTVLALLFVGGTCGPSPRVPAGVAPPEPPFERAPYVQLVTETSAVVRWRAGRPGPGSLRYRGPGGAWIDATVQGAPGPDRHSELLGLEPGSTVEYVVREGSTRAGPYRFRTAPADTSRGPIRVLGFGDSGWGSRSQVRLAGLMKEGSWDLAVHVGDVAYDHGSEEDLTQRHFRVYGSLFAEVPFFPTPGNHDLETEDGAPYDRAFDWPGEQPGRRYYAFRWGRARFVSLDTSGKAHRRSLEKARGAQYRWLVSELQAAARDTTLRWLVVFSHYPIYSHGSGLAAHGPEEELREELEPLFLEHGVDLVLAGHEHHYERSRPLREGEVVGRGCGPVYMIVGGGGAARYARAVTPDAHTARVDRSHHFVGLVLGSGSIEGRAVSPDGRVFDRFQVLPYDPGVGEGGQCEG